LRSWTFRTSERIRIAGAVEKSRVAFDVKHAREKLFAEGAFKTLNEEARAIFFVVAETGMRPSEVCALNATTIKLEASVPHVQVRADGREMKTDQSKRDIPLVGVALAALQRFPNGFPNYFEKADSLSATVNKHLETHGFIVEEG
jgi:integrase